MKGLLFTLVFTLTLASCGRDDGQSNQRDARDGRSSAVPVRTAPAARADIHVYLTNLGTVTALETVTVRSRVDGQLMSARFEEGQTVKAGDLLAQIDPRPFQVQLEQAQGQLARDQALLNGARSDLERYHGLLKEDSIAAQQVRDQETLVGQYEGAVKLDQAQVDSARLQLDYTRITAPISGRLGLRLVDPGNIVHASDAGGLVVITRVQPIAVVFTVPQNDLPAVLENLGKDAPLPVEIFDRDGVTRLASGRLTALDNQIDTATGTVKLKAEFANDDGRLFPNQFVNVRLLVATLHDVITVPSSAVQQGPDGSFVYVVNNEDTVALRSVQPGAGEGALTSIASGLGLDDRVVVDGLDRLRDGASVTLPGSDDAAQPTSGTPAAAHAGKQ